MTLEVDTRTMMLESADRLLGDLCTPELVNRAENGEWPADLWQAIEAAGLTLVSVPEDQGGVGGSLADLAAVLRLVGFHAVPLPVAETALARCIGSLGGLELPDGPLTVAVGDAPLQVSADGKRVSGTVRGIPWLDQAETVVAVGRNPQGRVHAICLRGAQGGDSAPNAAGEPRGRLTLSDSILAGVGTVPLQAGDARALAAFMRLQQTAGAAQRVMGICLDYARERKQFGKAIVSFQAVQQLLAELAGQVAAVQSAAESAADAAAAGDLGLPLAAGKVRASENAGRISAMAHQVLGAMGFTYEHRLHHFTRRLWAWRDEYGSDTFWADQIGREVVATGADALWPRLSGYAA